MVRISDCSSKPVRILSYTLIVTGAIVLTMFIIPLFSGTLNTGSYFGFVIGGVTVLLGIFTPKLFSNAKKAVRYIFRAVLIIYGVLAVYAITLGFYDCKYERRTRKGRLTHGNSAWLSGKT